MKLSRHFIAGQQALLILDEPTALLTPQDVDELFVIMHGMVKDGHALIFISHKLHEVVEISNRVTVLRDGRKIGTRPTSGVTKQILANWMVGREIGFTPDRGNVDLGQCRLRLDQVACGSDRGTPGLRNVSLEVYSGEILGIAGVSGNGQRELAEASMALITCSMAISAATGNINTVLLMSTPSSMFRAVCAIHPFQTGR